MDLEEENRILREQNQEIFKKLETLEVNLSNLVKNLFQTEVMNQVEEARNEAREAKDISKELVDMMIQSMEEWNLEPDQKKLQKVIKSLQQSGQNF